MEVTSTVFVVALGALGLLASVIVPALPALLALIPDGVTAGQLWRVVTWPIADQLSLWSLLNLVLLWYFGNQLEAQVGRGPMARLYVMIWASLTATTMLVGLFAPGSAALLGLDLVQFFILLLWIAEYPARRFFFNIPAWVIGAVLLGLQVLQMIGGRAWGNLLILLIALALVAIAAKRAGLLTTYSWIPGDTRTASRRSRRTKQAPSRSHRRHTTDEERLDDLLGKISSEGIHSLSKSERAELEKLRLRRRR